ncbi:DUF4188 domain-containing protein [Gordonia sp. ABSL1-1]|uniref:DUF4188 domain-containing protein n=1 Tax=Gordonia sp. ABSL1-1 TaxID=3053923 RepID=UPI0025743875|nr:DUF4188 domain-containing protein [Gordonia sp. ABSL1-1]MDL9936548.1 DUF4188 domain-containing protein [Gordonia sp. ABSL1-1]
MSKAIAARFTNQTPPPGTAMFLIGMRVTRPWRLGAWLAVFLAMPRMLWHLHRHPDAGMLSGHLYVGRSLMLVSYWRSADDIQRFAAAGDAPHLAVWRRFTGRYAGTGSVGIWHETYVIGEHESVSSGMSPWGLTEAVGWRLVGAGTQTAGTRLRASAAEAR